MDCDATRVESPNGGRGLAQQKEREVDRCRKECYLFSHQQRSKDHVISLAAAFKHGVVRNEDDSENILT